MFNSVRSKSAIGVIALLFLTTLTPSAVAGKPGSTVSLNGTVCKSFAGTWISKVRTCYITGNGASNVDFNIDARSQLVIENAGNFTNYGVITNFGSVVNYGNFTTSNNFTNQSTLVNFGNIYSSYHITNNGFIQQNSNWYGCVYNNSVVDGFFTNC